jgi:hypothetical protein
MLEFRLAKHSNRNSNTMIMGLPRGSKERPESNDYGASEGSGPLGGITAPKSLMIDFRFQLSSCF